MAETSTELSYLLSLVSTDEYFTTAIFSVIHKITKSDGLNAPVLLGKPENSIKWLVWIHQHSSTPKLAVGCHSPMFVNMAVTSGPAGPVLARPVFTVIFKSAHAQIMNNE